MSTPERLLEARRCGGAPGYTLTELLVAMSIAAVLLGLAIPSFNTAITNSRLTGYANELVASALLARGEAIKRNVTVTLCASADGATCAAAGSWEQGYIVKCAKDPDNADACDRTPAGNDQVLVLAAQKALATGFKMSEQGDKTNFDFRPNGTGATTGQLTICRSAPLGATERQIRISVTGRPSVVKTETGVCT